MVGIDIRYNKVEVVESRIKARFVDMGGDGGFAGNLLIKKSVRLLETSQTW